MAAKTVTPTEYEQRLKAMELAIKSQRGAPHYSTLTKVAKAIYEWLKTGNHGKNLD